MRKYKRYLVAAVAVASFFGSSSAIGLQTRQPRIVRGVKYIRFEGQFSTIVCKVPSDGARFYYHTTYYRGELTLRILVENHLGCENLTTDKHL